MVRKSDSESDKNLFQTLGGQLCIAFRELGVALHDAKKITIEEERDIDAEELEKLRKSVEG